MRENVRILVAQYIKPRARGQKIVAGLCQFTPPFAVQQGFEPCP